MGWVASAAALAVAAPSGGGVEGYLRQPDVHGAKVVFVAEGDLFVGPSTGGLARRLTSHAGPESTPHFGPAGERVAYVGRREGVPDLYRVDANGGEPTRLTWDGLPKAVVGWTPDGRILLRNRRYVTLPGVELAAVDPNTGAQERIPLFRAAEGAFGPAAESQAPWTLYFTRPRRQSSRTKGYRGGWMQRIWQWRPGDPRARPVTPDDAPARGPMVVGDRLFHSSDRGGTPNLWSTDLSGDDLKQHTRFEGIGVRETGTDGRTIVLRVGADLYLWDPASDDEPEPIPLTLSTDLDHRRRRFTDEVWPNLRSAALAPDGSRVVLTIRGAAYVVPAGIGRTIRLHSKELGRLREVRFLGTEGNELVAFSDGLDGELDLVVLSSRGIGPAERLTEYGPGFRDQLTPSPDGQRIAFRDRAHRLHLYDRPRDVSIVVDRSDIGSFSDLAWSRDSRWLAYVAVEPNHMRTVRLFDTKTGRRGTVSSPRTDSHTPAFDPEGQHLYFLTDRNLVSSVPSPWGTFQPEPYFDERTFIVGLPLSGPERSPFDPADELHPGEKEDADGGDDAGGGSNGRSEGPHLTAPVQLGGAFDRLFRVPVPPDNYRDLTVAHGRLFATRTETPYGGKKELVTVEIRPRDRKGPELKTVASDITGYALSPDLKILLLREKESLRVIPAAEKLPDDLAPHTVDLSGVHLEVDPKFEWQHMFHEAWRLQRDYFYDPGLHGVDWAAVRRRYLPLVDRVSDRQELNDLIAQMVSELGALHTFVFGGDVREDRTEMPFGHLGARLERVPDGFRIDHVYVADPDRMDLRSPLAEPSAGIREGDLILAVNGASTREVFDVGALLQGTAGRPIRLRLRRGDREWSALVTPSTAKEDSDLRYAEWEYTRRLRVEELSRGQIGYVHLRSMGRDDIGAWARQFHPVQNAAALIIDVRNNRGGNIDSWILEKLLRKAWFWWKPRNARPLPNMQSAFRGHMIVLVNERTASDGEAFAEGFRRLGLGPVYGVRTWGGEIWLSYNTGLVDGGMASVAQIGVYGPEGAWLIEGYGVEPDVVVRNDPHRAFAGEDALLDRAVDDLLEKLAADPRPIPSPPPYPDHNRRR